VRVFYRLRQFWLALKAVPDTQDLALAAEVLSPEQMKLFKQMQSSEQAHSLWIFRQMRQHLAGVDLAAQHDLLVAALLHDVGKSRHPLRLWERAVIVLGNTFFPNLVQQWGLQPPGGWKRPFVISVQHPAWGAEMAEQAGASPLAAALVRRHQENLDGAVAVEDLPLEDQLLQLLQRFDEER
jgi:hypothetical protein